MNWLVGSLILALIGAASGVVLRNVVSLSLGSRPAAALGALAAPVAGAAARLFGAPTAAPLLGAVGAALLILAVERYRRRVR